MVKTHERAGTKSCSRCNKNLPLESFSSGRNQCKPCRVEVEQKRYASPEVKRHKLAYNKVYYGGERENIRKQQAGYYVANKDVVLARANAHYSKEETRIAKSAYNELRYEQKREEIRAKQKAYFALNRPAIIANISKRRAAILNATPVWANDKAILAKYKKAVALTLSTGIPHEVDHTIPLKGKLVCGLHVHNNLQILSRRQNRKKKNSFVQDIF